MPSGLAAFGWSVTMWVTSYWAHPSALAAFPAGQVAWMVVSPIATACLVAGSALLARRLPLAPRTVRYQAGITVAGGTGVVLLAAGSVCWLSAAGHDPVPLFRTGVIGQASLVVLAFAAVAAITAARQSWTASRALAGSSAR